MLVTAFVAATSFTATALNSLEDSRVGCISGNSDVARIVSIVVAPRYELIAFRGSSGEGCRRVEIINATTRDGAHSGIIGLSSDRVLFLITGGKERHHRDGKQSKKDFFHKIFVLKDVTIFARQKYIFTWHSSMQFCYFRAEFCTV